LCNVIDEERLQVSHILVYVYVYSVCLGGDIV